MSKRQYRKLPQVEQERIATEKFTKLLEYAKSKKQVTKAFQYGVAVGSARAEQRHGNKAAQP